MGCTVVLRLDLCWFSCFLLLTLHRKAGMENSRPPYPPFDLSESTSSNNTGRFQLHEHGIRGGPRIQSLKKRGHGSRSWIKINQNGNSEIVELDKAFIMRHCSLPARDLRLLDPLFIYPSTILGREKAIVVSLEKIRCIITAEEVILMNSLDGCVVQYKSELSKRLQSNKDQSGKEITFKWCGITSFTFFYFFLVF